MAEGSQASRSRRLIPIGKFAQMSCISVKTLHFWDEIGLLRPAFTDPENGYRYYTASQMPLADEMQYLVKVARLPLEEAQAALGSPPQERKALLERHLQRLNHQMAELRVSATLVEQYLLHPEKRHYHVETREVQAQPAALIRTRSGFDGDRLSADRNQAFDELYALLAEQGVTATGPHFCEWPRNEKWNGSDFAVWMGVPVECPAVPQGRVEMVEAAGGHYARAFHHGHYYFLGEAHTAVAQWIQEQGRRWDSYREHYLYGPRDTAVLEHHRTEVCYRMV